MTKTWFLIFENEMMWGQNCCKILFFSQKKTRFPSLSFSVYTFLAGAEDQEQTISIELKKTVKYFWIGRQSNRRF